MPTLQVFDPPMCCDTGVCGPQVDPVLPRFASDLECLASLGVTVSRHNLAQDPGAFVAVPLVKQFLQEKGNNCLPLLLVDGQVVSEGSYPDRATLLALVGAPKPAAGGSHLTPAVRELIALAVAISAHSDQAFHFHFDRARKLGVSKEDLIQAVDVALNVQDGAANLMLNQARKSLGIEAPSDCSPGSGCC